MEDGTYCAGCRRRLDEPGDRPVGDRVPCPDCGATARHHVRSMREHVSGGAVPTVAVSAQAAGHAVAPAVHVSGGGTVRVTGEAKQALPPLSESIRGQLTVPAIVRRLVMMEPSDERGSYTVMAYDEHDRLLATTEEPTLDDALLAIADERLWEQSGE